MIECILTRQESMESLEEDCFLISRYGIIQVLEWNSNRVIIVCLIVGRMGRICAVLCMVLGLSVLMGFCEIAIHHETHAPSSIQWSIIRVEQSRTVEVLSNANAYYSWMSFMCRTSVGLREQEQVV